MACVTPDGRPTESGMKMLSALRLGLGSPEEVAGNVGVPLFRVRSGLRELTQAGLAIDKGDKFWDMLEKKMKAMAKAKWPDTPFKKIKTFIKEYDEDDDEAKYGFAGKKVITASNKNRPGILVKTDGGLVEPMSDNEIYSGMEARISFNVGCYSYNKSKGITFYLNNVLKTGEGERFSGALSAEDDFAEYLDSGAEDEWDN